ncbi:hypothetical protein RDABS01_010797 [Bienertia sinuspersici]
MIFLCGCHLMLLVAVKSL